ncbi:hypothetical protein GCM10023190_17460 [Enteractinococcus fodinae]|uniref:Uncharacterized protein n=2 Tax=Enteractinococcus fodinae TaxID=684663 RepID=A0ABU2AZ00_9MICC|nr:hypothetical protein [Enteractinococcus fodinae]
MSVVMGALIASGSLVLSAVVHRMTLIQDDLIAIGMAVIPVGLTLISALVLVGYSWRRRRKGLTLRPALTWLIVWSVVGVPVLAVGSHSIPYLLGAGSEYGQAAVAIICLYLMLHGWWIALLISAGIAVGVGLHRRQTPAS